MRPIKGPHGKIIQSMPNTTCSGVCCAAFTMSASYEEIVCGASCNGDLIKDGDYIAAMLIPLTTEEAAARGERFGTKSDYPPQVQFYTCKHWNESTRLCNAYDQRPGMCRKYPYEGQSCEFACGYNLPSVE